MLAMAWNSMLHMHATHAALESVRSHWAADGRRQQRKRLAPTHSMTRLWAQGLRRGGNT